MNPRDLLKHDWWNVQDDEYICRKCRLWIARYEPDFKKRYKSTCQQAAKKVDENSEKESDKSKKSGKRGVDDDAFFFGFW